MRAGVIEWAEKPLPELHWRCQNRACGALSAALPLPDGMAIPVGFELPDL